MDRETEEGPQSRRLCLPGTDFSVSPFRARAASNGGAFEMSKKPRWMLMALVVGLACAPWSAALTSDERSPGGTAPTDSDPEADASEPEIITPYIEKVVVTAQKREQSAQDIGVAITTIPGDEIAELRLTTPQDIAGHVPNLNIKNTLGTGNAVVTIRGVGVNDFNANADQSVGVYVDEVFMANAGMISFQMFDLEQVEVLRGPQGTLYGRNTTGGALLFRSARPTDAFEGKFELGYGEYGRASADGFLSGPLSDDARARFAFTGDSSSGGHVTNTFTGNDDYGQLRRWAARGTLEWDASENVDFSLIVHDSHDGSDAGSNQKALGVWDAPGSSVTCAPALAGNMEQTRAECVDLVGLQDTEPDPYTGAWSRDPEFDIDQYGLVAKIDWDVGTFTVTTVTGYEGWSRKMGEGNSGGRQSDGQLVVGANADYDNSIDQFSQEIRLTSNEPWNPEWLTGDVDWIVGAFWHLDDREGSPNQSIDIQDWFNDLLVVEWEQDAQSAALFAHLEWQLAEQWQLILGGRYTWEEKDFVGSTSSTAPYGVSGLTGLDFGITFAETDDRISDNEFTGTIGLEWEPTDDSMVYASFSKGFKSGGFNGGFAGSPEELEPFDEEELFAYEVGFKSRLAHNTMQLNLSGFYYDYEGMQLFAVPAGTAIPTIRLTNADQAVIFGAEAELWWRPAPGWDVKGGIGWKDTENKDSRFRGLELPNAPEVTFNGLVRYAHLMTGGRLLIPMIDFSYTDDMFKTVDNKPLLVSDSYWLLNARLAVRLDDNWEISAWGKNLTDETYVAEAFDQEAISQMLYLYNMPLTWGVTASYSF
jgi:iron complex outermembrane receptor protein